MGDRNPYILYTLSAWSWIVILCVWIVCDTNCLMAQERDSTKIQHSSYFANRTFPKKQIQQSAGYLLLSELIPLSFDRYIKKADYAKISFGNIATNLNPANWTWDDDEFETNQLGHPFHGSIFFNAFRSNGYNFWQSVPAAFAGSYLWETFAESQLPSRNDFINTGFGGVMLGEMTYRLSQKLIHAHTNGFLRKATHIFAYLINPAGGFIRLTDPKRSNELIAREKDSSDINIEFDIGVRKFHANSSNPFPNGDFGLNGRMKLIYGSPSKNLRQPFSNIYVTLEAGQDSAILNAITVHGSLSGWRFNTDKLDQLLILSANYDYLNNAAFFYSAQSINLSMYSEIRLSGKNKLNTSIGLGAVILAAVPDGYHIERRNYDYSSGGSCNASLRFLLGDRLYYRIGYTAYRTKTVSGNNSDYFLQTLTNEAGIRMKTNVYLIAESSYFKLNSNYSAYRDTTKKYPYIRLSFRYTLRL